MTYAAVLPVLQQEWHMSAVQAGSIASGFSVGIRGVFGSLLQYCRPDQRSNSVPLVLIRLRHLLAGFRTSGSGFPFRPDPLHPRRRFLGRHVHHGNDDHCRSVCACQEGHGGWLLHCQHVLRVRPVSCISGIALPLGGYRLSFFLTCIGPMAGWLLAWITLRHTVVPVPERRADQRFAVRSWAIAPRCS